jgi:hypothetical protein
LTLHQCGDCTPAVRASDYPNDATFFSPPFLGAYDACDTPGDCAVGPRPPRRGSPPSYTYAGATRLRITGGAATPSAPALFSPQTSLQVLEKNMGKHREPHVVLPACLCAHCIVVHPQLGLAFFEALCKRPAQATQPDKEAPEGACRRIAERVGIGRAGPRGRLLTSQTVRSGSPSLHKVTR